MFCEVWVEGSWRKKFEVGLALGVKAGKLSALVGGRFWKGLNDGRGKKLFDFGWDRGEDRTSVF